MSERKKQKKAISEMAIIIQSSADAIISKKLDGTILTWNKAAEKILGYTFDEVKGKQIAMLFPPELLSEESILIGKILNGEIIEQYETVRVRKDQIKINVSITLSAIKDGKGNIVAVSKILRDITQQKRAELELRQSNESNKIFIQEAPNAIAMFDTDMRYLAASNKWLEDYKLEGRELIGHSHYEIFPEIGDDWKAIHQECLKGAVNQCDEAAFERADGTEQWITWDVRAWYKSPSDIGGIIMYTADITKQKEKDAEKRRIEEILDKTNEVARIGTWEVDMVNNTINWSRVTKEIHEVLPDYVPNLETAIHFFKEGSSRDAIQRAFEAAVRQGTSYDLELELVTAERNVVWVRSIGQTEFKNGVCKRVFGVFQNIDEVKKSRESLMKMNLELQTIFNSGYVSIIGTNKDGLVTHFNAGAESLLQYSASEIINLQTPAIFHVEEEVLKRGQELSDIYGREISGFDVFIEIAKQGQHESREWTYVRKDGSTFPVQLIVTAIKNEKDEITGFLGVATDITERKNTEEKLRNYSILESKSKEMEQFAYIASHDLREPLLTIKNFSKLLEEDCGNFLDEGGKMYTDSIIHAANRMDILIKGLLDYTRLSKAKQLQKVNANELMKDVLADLNHLITSTGSEIIVSNLPVLNAYPLELKLLFQNLISNAIKFSDNEVTPVISISAERIMNGWQFAVKDNGIGIAENDQKKIFKIFSRLHHKDKYEGTGLGLAQCKKIAELHNGNIWVESKEGNGSTFYFTIVN